MSTGTEVETENGNTYATVLESELAKDRSLYTRFDDLTLEVMQKNAAVIAQEASKGISIEEMPATTLKFDLRSGMIHSSEPQKCTLNLLEACRAAWAVNGETLPTTNIVLMDLRVTAVSSTLDQPARLVCTNSNKVPGTFTQSSVRGDHAEHRTPCLDVIEPHFRADGLNKSVYKAGAFVHGDTFRQYHKALTKDIQQHVTAVSGANCVEYLSPWASHPQSYSEEGESRADWFVEVMYKNPESFKHPVQAVRSPSPSDESQYVISLRVQKGDWEELMTAVSSAVIEPLYQGVLSIEDANEQSLVFLFQPTAAAGWANEKESASVCCHIEADIRFV